MLVCSLFRPLRSTMFRLWWCLVDGAQGWHVLCAPLMVKYKPKLCVSLSIAMVIDKSGCQGRGRLGETNCDIKQYTPTLPI